MSLGSMVQKKAIRYITKYGVPCTLYDITTTGHSTSTNQPTGSASPSCNTNAVFDNSDRAMGFGLPKDEAQTMGAKQLAYISPDPAISGSFMPRKGGSLLNLVDGRTSTIVNATPFYVGSVVAVWRLELEF